MAVRQCLGEPVLPELAAEGVVVDPLRDESADIAREAGVLVSFDLNYWAALCSADDAGEVFRSLIAQADIVFAGDDEAAIAVGPSEDSLELARRVAPRGPARPSSSAGPRAVPL